VSTVSSPTLSPLAIDVADGFSKEKKQLPSRYLYDDLGSALFEAITLLPEYGLTRAEERLLNRHSPEIAAAAGSVPTVCELGSGSGKKTRYLLDALSSRYDRVVYRPIDVSSAALEMCGKEVSDICEVQSVRADWIDGLGEISLSRAPGPLLVLFLGSSIGNLEPKYMADFLARVRATLYPGDLFLLGADIVKDVATMIAAYDDPTGITAAFNLNVLGRLNRELDACFDLRSFAHEVRWNSEYRRIEMHLVSSCDQTVPIRALDSAFSFYAGETIWTESSHKFSKSELPRLALESDFEPLNTWVDREWPFAEMLWRAKD
jgi:L-histidine N-alpha-methyltransferase